MKFLNKLFKGLMRIIKKIVKFIKKNFKWILIVAVIAFAPQIATFLVGQGAPTWLSGAFSFIGSNVTEPLKAAGSWIAAEGKSMIAGAGTAFSDAKLGTKAAIVAGSAALIAPETVGKVVGKAGEAAGSFINTGVSGILSGLTTGNTLLYVGLGLGAYLLLRSKRNA